MSPKNILENSLERALRNLEQTVVQDINILKKLDYVCHNLSNRAGVRLLMSCLLAKVDKPHVDPRKPYTEIGTSDCFSGRTYDEKYLTNFINKNQLPCNQTTAFLTPALRNINQPLTINVELVGRPRELYVNTLQLLDDVYHNRVSAEDLLVEVIRVLILMRNEKNIRMATLLAELQHGEEGLPLSSESIITLIEQHLACKNSSRLPVLIITAAYEAASEHLGEWPLPLNSHNAADLQTGAIGDVEVCLVGEDNVVTAYEMKMKRVTVNDIDVALEKILRFDFKIDNYIFITTDAIDDVVAEYAATFYEETDGIEIVILNCIGFIRHFLHFFHRIRINFLNAYQNLVLEEPDSAVSHHLKEAFLVLRKTAESDG